MTFDGGSDTFIVQRKLLRARVRKALGASLLVAILIGIFTFTAGPRTRGVYFVWAFDFRA